MPELLSAVGNLLIAAGVAILLMRVGGFFEHGVGG